MFSIELEKLKLQEMKVFKTILICTLASMFSLSAFAYKYVGSGQNPGMAGSGNAEQQGLETRAAQCAPATGLRDLEWNNVRTRIETGGSMWQDRANGRAAYEVPKDGGVSSIFAGGLWMGGLSTDQTLRLAAVRFREGNDYWPGPLTNDGTAEVSAATCVQYDQFAVTLRQDAQTHRLYFDMLNAGATQPEMEAAGLGDYTIPSYFFTYPAHGNTALLQDYYLAPFYNYDDNPEYDPRKGDYPWYDFLREIDCANRKREDQVPLYGDQNFYWIFNDKGNIHTESTGAPIGMEIRAQAFAFTSNDEINNMTFLNYVLINQGTQRLTETYFGSYIDPDLGAYNDDYVGCDVQRGLGYCYNGDGFDEPVSGSNGYGDYLPAVGVDFFEGPYQDADGADNPLTTDVIQAEQMGGIPYKGLGIGYGDDIVDNERYGMRRFVYYNNGSGLAQDPSQPMHYYNYMRGIWKNNQTMLYGGNGFNQGVVAGMPAQYMFPGDSDPYNWSTHGVVPTSGFPWTEVSANNQPGDRRFVQSAGPFTLEPGDYNNITLGVVWAQANSKNNNWEPVELLRLADDKAQSLFDNCFEIVSGPDAPDVAVRELDREIILMLSNANTLSNNYQENYVEFDPSIPDSLNGVALTEVERSYQFEGYLIYQLVDPTISSAGLNDPDKARLIAQCDVRNGITNIINYDRDGTTGLIVPQLMVQGADNGINRSFRITTDAFATSANTLVNHKTYYFMAIAYGYNQYAPYSIATNTGQSQSYKSSRKAAVGEVPVIKAIPHNVTPLNGGTVMNSSYGEGFMLTRLEGKGNGLQNLAITGADENSLLSSPFSLTELDYLPGRGPVNVKVVDPLRVPAADFELKLNDTPSNTNNIDSLFWTLTNVTDNEVYDSYTSFRTSSEDVVLDYGISIYWGQYEYRNNVGAVEPHKTALISGTIEFANNREPWLTGVPDSEGVTPFNWIRAGTFAPAQDNQEEKLYADYQFASGFWIDGEGDYEKILSGTVAPYCLVSHTDNGSFENPVAPSFGKTPIETDANNDGLLIVGDISSQTSRNQLLASSNRFISGLAGLNNVDVVITPDKSKWTRCPVLEMQPQSALAQNALVPSQGNPSKMKLRKHLSVDKNGKVAGEEGYNATEGGLTGSTGMGWFPGYAIDLGTGERLNMAFGEDSWLAGDNGRDMLWNPSSNYTTPSGEPVFGGQHWVYIFKNLRAEVNMEPSETMFCPRYDEGQYLYSRLLNGNNNHLKEAFAACTWVCSSILNSDYEWKSPEQGLVPGMVKLSLRVAKPYAKYAPTAQPVTNTNGAQNKWRNLYRFSTKGSATTVNVADAKEGALDMINIVPNPYYAFSGYETGKLDNRVKIVNLPEQCTINIYDLNGTLIRQFKKGDPTSSVDWDLKNHKNIPIASGTYIIHIDVPNVGEKVLKWFGVMRPVDLDNF
jgi:hypothetical protein